MKKIFFILAILAGILIIRMIISVDQPDQAAVMAENITPQATQEPTRTRKPTETPTPGVDHAATLAAANMQLDAANATSVIFQLTANAAIAQQVAATAAEDQRAHDRNMAILALENKHANIESTSIALTSTAQAPYQTERAVIHSIEIGILTMESSKITQTVEAPALIKKNIEAQYYDEARKAENFVLYSLGTSVLVVVLLLTAKTSVKMIQEHAQQAEPTKPPADDLPEGDYIEGIWMPTLLRAITREQLSRLAYGYFVRDIAITHSNWTPAKEKGFSESELTYLQHTFVYFNLAYWGDPTHKSSIILSDKGRAFLYRFLPEKYKITTPPLKKYYSEPLPQREEKTDRQTEEGRGAGEEG